MVEQDSKVPKVGQHHESVGRIALVFVLGTLCFLLTQVFTRIPLISWLQKQPGFMLWAITFPLFSGVMLALSAGAFEEVGRFLFKSVLLKPSRSPLWEPVVFGLGHGLCEAVWLFLPMRSMVGLIAPDELALPVFERVLAISMHIGFSVIVWNGFQMDQRWRYLVCAILLHGLVDALIPLSAYVGWGMLVLEGILAVIACLFMLYVIFAKRFYLKEDKDEKK